MRMNGVRSDAELRRNIRALRLVVATIVVMMGPEARAVTCSTAKTLANQTCTNWRTTSTGVKYCTAWCTGSEICDNTISGLNGSVVSGCTTGETCPLTSCAAFGTTAVDGSAGACDTSLDNLNESCGIKGIGVCFNPATKFNPQGQPFVLEGVEGTTSDTLTCDKKGKCANSLKLEPDDTSTICLNNWQFVTFTASEFKAKACFCPGGLDVGGRCCADSSRDSHGTCSTEYGTGGSIGTPICMIALCTVDLSGFDPQTNFNLPYDCHPAAAQTCGGVTGTPCP